MTFNDIFKSSFLEQAVDTSILDSFIALFVAFAIGLFIFMVYKKTYAGVMYQASFAVSIIAMTMITTLIILAVTSNIVLSLGMVGALSIVRFRTAVKEPLDIAYLFWAISVGIVVGAGLLSLALLGSILIGVMLLVFVNHKQNDTPYIALVHLDGDEAEKVVEGIFKQQTKKHLLKSKLLNGKGTELTIEVRLRDNETTFLNDLRKTPGVLQASLVSFNGDYLS